MSYKKDRYRHQRWRVLGTQLNTRRRSQLKLQNITHSGLAFGSQNDCDVDIKTIWICHANSARLCRQKPGNSFLTILAFTEQILCFTTITILTKVIQKSKSTVLLYCFRMLSFNICVTSSLLFNIHFHRKRLNSALNSTGRPSNRLFDGYTIPKLIINLSDS